LARNLDELRRIVLGLTERGSIIHIVFVKENLTFTGEVRQSPDNSENKNQDKHRTLLVGSSADPLADIAWRLCIGYFCPTARKALYCSIDASSEPLLIVPILRVRSGVPSH
jgi:alkanesulfonate monooxygenase SsuD/methylene tetrahydromethanopterin reductase-like flavin-dependent oxidoreductase (luciferase family)